MGVNNNNEPKGDKAGFFIKNEKKLSIINEFPRNSMLSQNSYKNSSLVSSKKRSLGNIFTIYDLFIGTNPSAVTDIARKSIVSIKSEKQKLDEERWYQILLQVAIPFLIAGMGTIGAGVVLNKVTKLYVFQEIKALFVLVPALLGLKGNLDMCLASRLSTQANLGNMEGKKQIFQIVTGNILLVQIQAIVASCVVSLFAVVASSLVNGEFKWTHTLLLATASTLTATMSCFILDLVLVTIIIVARKLKLNPDNMATPMAAGIGDVVSLSVLSVWATFLFNINDSYPWLMGIILATYIVILLPAWIYIVIKNEFTKDVLANGWIPVITALFISGSGGLILDIAIDNFNRYEMFQPIINGIGGNLVSVQASRISTMLHKTSFEGVIPAHTKQWVSPFKALIKGVLPAKSARLLLMLSIPGHILFVYVADAINSKNQISITVYFLLTYVTASFIQVFILLYLCHILVHTMWRYRIDPDNSAIPYLTAIGDLLGSTLLLLAFLFLIELGEDLRK